MLETKAKKKFDYAYSVGLIRTLETMLMNENELERMLLSTDAENAFKVLNEFDYADNKVGVEKVSEFQKVINGGLKEIKDRLTLVTPNKSILNIIWHKYDFHNIKTLLKGKLSGKTYEELEPLMNDLGAIDPRKLYLFIYEENSVSFEIEEKWEVFIKDKIKRAEKNFYKQKENPQVVDLYLDQKLIKLIFDIAKKSKSEFLIKYVKELIDLSNIKLFFRMKSQDKEESLYSIASMWNGEIPCSKFLDAYKHDLSEFPELMKFTKYKKIIEEGYKKYSEEHTFIYLEKEIENRLTDFIKKAKFMSFGPEPLVSYFLAKKNNALIIRMIMISKLNNIEIEEIRMRLRKLY